MAFDLQSTLKNSKAGTAALLFGLDEIRRQIILEKEALHHTRSQPVDKTAAVARLDEWLENESAAEAVKAFSRRFMASNYIEPSLPDGSAVMFAAVAWSIREMILQHLDAAFASVPGLSESQRRQKISACDQQLLRLELAEEATIREAEEAGVDILRRADADVRAVLASHEALATLGVLPSASPPRTLKGSSP